MRGRSSLANTGQYFKRLFLLLDGGFDASAWLKASADRTSRECYDIDRYSHGVDAWSHNRGCSSSASLSMHVLSSLTVAALLPVRS